MEAIGEFGMWFSAAGIGFFDVGNGGVENVLDFGVKKLRGTDFLCF